MQVAARHAPTPTTPAPNTNLIPISALFNINLGAPIWVTPKLRRACGEQPVFDRVFDQCGEQPPKLLNGDTLIIIIIIY